MKTKQLLTIISLLFLCSFASAQEDCLPEIGTNLGEFRTALVDIFKSSRSFWETDLDDYIWDTNNPLSLDINGYPTSLNTTEGRAARTLIWEALNGNYPTGTYTLLYDGEGTIELGMDATNPVFTNNGGTDNQIVFDVITTTNEGIMVDITATTVGNHVHNIRIIRPEHPNSNYVNTYATEPFTDLFYERHKYFQSVRFMDWMTTNWSVYSTWSQRPTWQKSTWTIHEAGPGVPVEVMVHVANRLQAHPWFCMPHRADDNYMNQFATYIRDNLDPDLKVSIEYSNEVWNGLFSTYENLDGQHTYALDMGAANGVTGYFEQIGYWVGRRSGEMFDIFESVFGSNDRLVKVIPIQTGPDLATPHTLDYLHNGTPLHEIGDVVAGAVYFGGEYDHDDLIAMTASELLDDMILNMYNFDSGPYWCLQTIDMLDNATYQASDLQFVAYEGGQHLANFAGTPEDNATATLIAANRHADMGNIYTDFYDWWATTGAGTFMAFTSIGEPSMFGAWGLLENIEQDTLDAPKWLATTQWIRDNACMTTALAAIDLEFQGKQIGDKNRLTWQLNSIENANSFLLEKMQRNDWTLLKEIEAKATNNNILYQWEDRQPDVGLNYYRLKVLNENGIIILEQVISVFYKKENTLQVLPTVVQDIAYLKMEDSPTQQLVNYQIFNSQGQFIKNGIYIFNQENSLDVSELTSGIYFIKMGQGDNLNTVRFIKL